MKYKKLNALNLVNKQDFNSFSVNKNHIKDKNW